MLRLRMMGLIESKKKKGAVITSPDVFGIMSKSMKPHILDEDTLKEMFELRLVLENRNGRSSILQNNQSRY